MVGNPGWRFKSATQPSPEFLRHAAGGTPVMPNERVMQPTADTSPALGICQGCVEVK
ncbi:unnamed protein product, partial [Enterobius vermicularis]|uniref:Nuclear receptor domain-containing protein n=1 Tax=Enterobius vermicularis TaxID=51028 RepID=A0A0N4VLU1_ENTVE